MYKGEATGSPEGSLPITGETTLRVEGTQLVVSTPGRQSVPSTLLLEIEGSDLQGWAAAIVDTVKLVAIVEASKQEPSASTWPQREFSEKSPRFTSTLRQFNTADDHQGQSGGTLDARGSSGATLSGQGGNESPQARGDQEPMGALRLLSARTSLELPHGQSVPLAAPELGSCGSSGRAWRL